MIRVFVLLLCIAAFALDATAMYSGAPLSHLGVLFMDFCAVCMAAELFLLAL